jgi:hypothetical protein
MDFKDFKTSRQALPCGARPLDSESRMSGMSLTGKGVIVWMKSFQTSRSLEPDVN